MGKLIKNEEGEWEYVYSSDEYHELRREMCEKVAEVRTECLERRLELINENHARSVENNNRMMVGLLVVSALSLVMGYLLALS